MYMLDCCLNCERDVVGAAEGYVTLGFPLRNTMKLPEEMSCVEKFHMGSFLRWELSCAGKFPAVGIVLVFFRGLVQVWKTHVKEIYYSIVAQADSTGV